MQRHEHHHLPHRHPHQHLAATQDQKNPLAQTESTASLLSDVSFVPTRASNVDSLVETPSHNAASDESESESESEPATIASSGSYLDQPFSVLWRKSLVSLPRLVPDSVLKYTSPEGPHPIVLKLPSHGKHHIPVYVFVPHASQPKVNPSAATTAAATVVEGVQAVAVAGAEGAPAIKQTKAELKKVSAEQKADAKKEKAEEKAEAKKASAEQKAVAKKLSTDLKAESKKALAEQKAEAKATKQSKTSDVDENPNKHHHKNPLIPATTAPVRKEAPGKLYRAMTATKQEPLAKIQTDSVNSTTDSETERTPTRSSRHKAGNRETTYKADATRRKLPVLVDFHGGSFILGSCQEQAPFCAQMARELDCIVISVDYRLGPYDKYPAANEDADDVLNAILNPDKPGYQELRDGLDTTLRKHAKPLVDFDTERVAISGFSSGGNLALGLMLSVKNDPTIKTDWPSPIPTAFAREIPVLLFYPSLDCRMLPAERPRPPGLDPEGEVMKAMALESKLMPTYLPVEKRGHPRASPGLVDLGGPDGSGLHSRARMLLILPQLDSLSEQSGVWVEKVKKEGRGEHLLVEKVDKVAHGWTQFPDSWLTKHDRERKIHVFAMARDFVDKIWGSRGASAVATEI